MKKISLLLIAAVALLSSCGINKGLTNNVNNHSTEVVLSKKNFKVIAAVQGEAKAMYVFGLGALTKKAMIAEARANMLAKANIVGGAKAIINETVEVKNSFFPIVRFYEVIVSGHVVEFTE
jgi:outer membrane lipopolysaccharide assembly protein LptE/RlpB